MGASSSQAPYTVEVRLECPQAPGQSGIFAHLHSAADGGQRYNAWGEPKILGLLPDDIITVSMFTAQSEQHFENLDYEEFAEVYLPWDVVSEKIADGAEEIFVLGLQPGSPWLGHNAQPAHYRSAYLWACNLAKDKPSAPHIRVGIRVLSHLPLPARTPAGKPELEAAPAVATSRVVPAEPQLAQVPQEVALPDNSSTTNSAAVACGVEELSPDEMKRLFQLQMKNKELLAQLHLSEGDVPDIEDQVQEHLAHLRHAVSQNYALRAALQREDRALAELSVALTPEQHLLLTSAASPVPTSQTLTIEDERDYERQAEALMGEIQAVTTGNIELIARYDHQIELLEAELVAACKTSNGADPSTQSSGDEARLKDGMQRLQSQMEELNGLEGECADLEALVAEGVEGAAKQPDMSSVIAQKLQLELEVQEEEIGNLRQILERQQAEGPPMPPGTGILQDQVVTLQADLSQEELRSREERALMEQQVDELRRESRALKEELEYVSEAKGAAEEELEDLRTKTQSTASTAAMEMEQVDEEVRMESLEKELTRCQRRIEFYDEKIGRLREEADDLRQRASHALQAALVTPGDREADGARVAELEETVQRKEREVELMKRREESLRAERDEAQQAFEMAKVEDRLMLQRNGREAE